MFAGTAKKAGFRRRFELYFAFRIECTVKFWDGVSDQSGGLCRPGALTAAGCPLTPSLCVYGFIWRSRAAIMNNVIRLLPLPFAFFLIAPLMAEPLLFDRPSAGSYGAISSAFTERGTTVLRPDTLAPEWWAGAPSVLRDDDGVFWMACRMRRGDGPRGLRGYEVRLLRSEDGVTFHTELSIKREAVPIAGFERPALLKDPRSGAFKLYVCGPFDASGQGRAQADGVDLPWCILKLEDAASPCEFIANTAKPVIQPPEKTYERDQPPLHYKDPVINYAAGRYHAYVIGYIRQNERVFHFTSEDGETWTPAGNPYEPIMALSGWHDFFVRPSSVVRTGAGYLFVYEGSKTTWYDPVYNVVTGIGYTFDLHTIDDLTPESPLAVSPTPNDRFATFRYSSWVRVGEEIYVYAEVACTDETHEIRLFKIPR